MKTEVFQRNQIQDLTLTATQCLEQQARFLEKQYELIITVKPTVNNVLLVIVEKGSNGQQFSRAQLFLKVCTLFEGILPAGCRLAVEL